jgi:hypothetical protein
LFENVAEVRASDFALPAEVRLRTRQANECSMGYAPTAVQSVNGERFIINWSADIFSSGGVSGKDIRLSLSQGFGGYPTVPITEQPTDAITFVYADWFDGCLDLKLPVELQAG